MGWKPSSSPTRAGWTVAADRVGPSASPGHQAAGTSGTVVEGDLAGSASRVPAQAFHQVAVNRPPVFIQPGSAEQPLCSSAARLLSNVVPQQAIAFMETESAPLQKLVGPVPGKEPERQALVGHRRHRRGRGRQGCGRPRPRPCPRHRRCGTQAARSARTLRRIPGSPRSASDPFGYRRYRNRVSRIPKVRPGYPSSVPEASARWREWRSPVLASSSSKRLLRAPWMITRPRSVRGRYRRRHRGSGRSPSAPAGPPGSPPRRRRPPARRSARAR